MTLTQDRVAIVIFRVSAVVLAVVLMAGIARAHAFEQANKRTAFETAVIFIGRTATSLARQTRPRSPRRSPK